MPNNKRNRSVVWWPADAIVCIASLLPIKYASHLITAAKINYTSYCIEVTKTFSEKSALFFTAVVPHCKVYLKHESSHCICFTNVRTLPFVSLMSGPCNTDFTLSRSCLSAWNMMMFLHFCITFETLLLVKKQSQNTVIKLRCFVVSFSIRSR